MIREYSTDSPGETIALGRDLANILRDCRLVLLRGDLGAGKTTLVKGIAEGFAAAEAEDVTSPTFTLVHEYRGPQRTLYHIDLYRIDTLRDLDMLGIDDLVRDEGNIVLIEWGEKFPTLAKQRDAEIEITRNGIDGRKLRLTCIDENAVGNK